jgi:hemerythrin-like domain-containing protein
MTAAANLQRQHRKLEEMAGELVRLSMRPFLDPAEVRRSLASFSGTLRVHAAMEEEALYPELLASPDPEVRKITLGLHRELDGLYRRWDEFVERWKDADAIAKSTFTFRFDLARVLAVLARRMKREDRELYPLAERHAAASRSSPR